VTEESILAVQIFDQRKFKKKDQGFLGVVNVRIGSVIDLDAGGDGEALRAENGYTSCQG
jgi:E3 ubiquitin-protein ligase NEDD4